MSNDTGDEKPTKSTISLQRAHSDDHGRRRLDEIHSPAASPIASDRQRKPVLSSAGLRRLPDRRKADRRAQSADTATSADRTPQHQPDELDATGVTHGAQRVQMSGADLLEQAGAEPRSAANSVHITLAQPVDAFRGQQPTSNSAPNVEAEATAPRILYGRRAGDLPGGPPKPVVLPKSVAPEAALMFPAFPDREHATGNSRNTDAATILAAANEAAYHWDLTTDQISWIGSPAATLDLEATAVTFTGSAFQQLIAPDSAVSRYRVVTGQADDSTPADPHFRLQYRFFPKGRRRDHAVWLEEEGRWIAGESGQPVAAQGVLRRIDRRRSSDEQLIHLSEHDELTGHMNRPRLVHEITHMIAQCKVRDSSAAFLVCAVNNLRMINETFGFETGDEIIASVGHRLKARMRSGDQIGRLSGNKFGLVIYDCETEGVRAAARRFFESVQTATIDTKTGQIAISMSIGAVLVPQHAEHASDVITCGLIALEQTKSQHQNNLIIYTPSPRKDSLRKKNVLMVDELVAALKEDRMRIALQPIVETRSKRPALHECLLRMERPDGTIVSAGEFIPVAEQLGLSGMIDLRVLELSIDLMKRDPDLHLTVNVSGLTATNHDWLVELQRRSGGDRSLTSRLVVEITETEVIQDIDESVSFVDALKELGCRVAIDDFGAGYTSFRNLRHLGVDMLKIDGSFMRDLTNSTEDRIFVESLVGLAQRLGLETVAESVVDEATAAILADFGITYLQGYLFGKPELADAA